MAIQIFDRRLRRKRRVRGKVFGTADKPRISVFRSNRHLYVQAVNDEKKITLCSFSSLNLKDNTVARRNVDKAQAEIIGKELAERLKKNKIHQAVFDRGYYAYHGQVAAVAQGLRKGGIKI